MTWIDILTKVRRSTNYTQQLSIVTCSSDKLVVKLRLYCCSLDMDVEYDIFDALFCA